MQTISISRSQHLKATVILWIKRLMLLFLLLALLMLLNNWSIDRMKLLAAVFLLVSIGDAVTRFHVKKIMLNDGEDMLQLNLVSTMSGDKKMEFPLQGMVSSVRQYAGISRLWNGAVVMRFSDAKGNGFRITPRYGFSPQDLLLLNDWIGNRSSGH